MLRPIGNDLVVIAKSSHREEVTMSEYDKELRSDSEEVDDAQKALGRDARDKRRDDERRVKPDDHPSETRDE